MQKIEFLSAALPLTKTFYMEGPELKKEAYPLLTRVTSHQEEITTTLDLFKVIKAHAAEGHCLLKGNLIKPVVNESRKGTTLTDGVTSWICLDFDRYKVDTLAEAMTTLGLNDIDHVVQWSSSHGMPGTEGTISCHAFMLLKDPVAAPVIKLWLMGLNLKYFGDQLSLSRDANTIRWPLDVTTCQNDKLLYIATPTFKDNIKDPVKIRIEFVKGKLPTLPTLRMAYASPDVVRKQTKDNINALRATAGMSPQRGGTKFVGDTEVQNKPGEALVTGVKDCEEYIRLNINGGDSWAYWHFKDNFELIRCFKSNVAFHTKELLPGYYTDLVAARNAQASTPTDDGDIVLAFRDFYSDWYFNGLWNPTTQELKLVRTKSETRVEAWLHSFSKPIPAFIPIWEMEYNPRAEYIVDEAKKKVNTYAPSLYRKNAKKREVMIKEECPTIYRVMRSLIGDDDKVEDSFCAWLAMIFQNIAKPRVSWVFHGIEGTGKGVFINEVCVPIFGKNNMALKRASQLNDQFNGWLEQTLLNFIDEVDVEDFKDKGAVTANLRNYITEPTLSVRKMQTTSYEVPSYCGFIFSSNRPQPVYIPPTDRRYNLGRFQGTKLLMTDHEKYELIPLELQAFADHLYSIRVNTEFANAICDTPDRQRVARLAMTSVEVTANAIVNGDFDALWDAMPDEDLLATLGAFNNKSSVATAYAMFLRNIARGILAKDEDCEKLSREEVQLIFAHVTGLQTDSPNKFTSFLRHLNIELERLRRGEKRFTGLRVKWVVTGELTEYLTTLFVPKKVAPKQGPARAANPNIKAVK